jgi:hypothetical protein
MATGVPFGPSFLPELREILLSTGTGYSYGPDGELAAVTDEPFLGPWRLRSLAYDRELGKSRVVCVLVAGGNEVTATIDAGDFPRLRRNSTRTRSWNGSDRYHDMAVQASVLIEEQILTRDPEEVSGVVRIQVPADRAGRA